LDGIVYDSEGNRIGFTSTTCPSPVHKGAGKGKKYPVDKPWPRIEASPLPELTFSHSAEDFEGFLRRGQVSP
jgi:hypothetical protein